MADLYRLFIEIENSKVKVEIGKDRAGEKKQYLKIFPPVNRSFILLKEKKKNGAFVRITLKQIY